MKASVALAYYNGKEYIKEQLESVLCQLGEDDEIIISVDAATDGSMDYLMEISTQDSRVHLLQGPGKGVVKNFENAVLHCTGDIILLCDQDDIWMKNKLAVIKKYFDRDKCSVLLHNASLVDQDGKSLGQDMFALRKSRAGLIKNLIKNSYVGCCMAFRRELMPVICPIPSLMYMHDYWIGTIGELCGGVAVVRRPLIKYRRHEANVTQMSHGSWKEMLMKRAKIMICLGHLMLRRARLRRKVEEELS